MPENFENPATLLDDKNKDIKEVAKNNYDKWGAALLEKDPEIVAKLYSDESTFLPTVSPDFKKGPNEAAEYFTHFLEKNPSGKIISEEIQELGPDSYLHSGLYDFEVGPPDNRQVIEARFSFVWKKNEAGEWEIVHHHSSTKPQN